ncbi:hypothetical protein PG997_005898 [Apiospora hydei]|uniref:Uncharacterized protein n=1 Tax=Apiospora hydei TaxID=1337664 RepID=A0ABR1WMB4_9PEZI
MARLCTNRPEGFGPMSNLTPHLPTQCFFDSVLAPMPTFLFLVSLPTMVIVSWWRRRRRGGRINNYLYPRSSPYPFPLTNGGNSDSGGGSGSGSRNANTLRRYPTTTTDRQSVATLLKRLLPSLGYYGAVAVILLMQSVEIVQLERASLGIGLLPVVYAGPAGAALLRLTEGQWRRGAHHRGGRRLTSSLLSEALSPFWVASLFLWTGSAAVTATKTIALATGLGLLDRDDRAPLSRADTPYPVVHQFVDLVILTAFYALAAAGEVGMTVRRGKERRAGAGAGVAGIEEDAVQLRESFAHAAATATPAPTPTTNHNDK